MPQPVRIRIRLGKTPGGEYQTFLKALNRAALFGEAPGHYNPDRMKKPARKMLWRFLTTDAATCPASSTGITHPALAAQGFQLIEPHQGRVLASISPKTHRHNIDTKTPACRNIGTSCCYSRLTPLQGLTPQLNNYPTDIRKGRTPESARPSFIQPLLQESLSYGCSQAIAHPAQRSSRLGLMFAQPFLRLISQVRRTSSPARHLRPSSGRPRRPTMSGISSHRSLTP